MTFKTLEMTKIKKGVIGKRKETKINPCLYAEVTAQLWGWV